MRTMLALAAGVTTAVLAASAAAAAPPVNVVGLSNLALNQMLTLSPTGAATTTWASGSAAQVFDQIYQVSVPTEPGMSSPYQLRAQGTNLCLQDVGEGRSVIALECETNPASGSTQLWQIHRVADRQVGNRLYYFQFNRRTDRVLTAFPTATNPDSARVLSLPAQPISKSGAADVQLWTTLAAA